MAKGFLFFSFGIKKNSPEKVETIKSLRKSIAIMLNDHLKTSIDPESVEDKASFLSTEVPKLLELWEEADKELLFNKLWKILEELKFTDKEIGIAWGVALYVSI